MFEMGSAFHFFVYDTQNHGTNTVQSTRRRIISPRPLLITKIKDSSYRRENTRLRLMYKFIVIGDREDNQVALTKTS
jgi:hypothetical protein